MLTCNKTLQSCKIFYDSKLGGMPHPYNSITWREKSGLGAQEC